MGSGSIKEIVCDGKTYDVKEDSKIVWHNHEDIDECGLVGTTGEAELIEAKTDRRVIVSFKITSSRYKEKS